MRARFPATALFFALTIPVGAADHGLDLDDAGLVDRLAKADRSIANYFIRADDHVIHIMLTPTEPPVTEANELNRMGEVGRSFCFDATAPFTWASVWTAHVMSPDLTSPVFVCKFPADPAHLRQ